MYVTHWEGICCAWRVQTSTASRGQINLVTLLFTECNFDLLFHLFSYISEELWCEKGAYTGGFSLFQGNPAYCFILYCLPKTYAQFYVYHIASFCPKI